MVEEKDEGKRCRLIRNGRWGRDNLKIYGKEGFDIIFQITEVYKLHGWLFVKLEPIFPKTDNCPSECYVERVELIDDNELNILT